MVSVRWRHWRCITRRKSSWAGSSGWVKGLFIFASNFSKKRRSGSRLMEQFDRFYDAYHWPENASPKRLAIDKNAEKKGGRSYQDEWLHKLVNQKPDSLNPHLKAYQERFKRLVKAQGAVASPSSPLGTSSPAWPAPSAGKRPRLASHAGCAVPCRFRREGFAAGVLVGMDRSGQARHRTLVWI